MTVWILRIAVLAGALALAACGGSGGAPAMTPGTGTSPDTGTPPDPGDTPPPGAGGEPAAALVSGLYFDYELTRAGAPAIAETGSVPLSCPGRDCPAQDLRQLADGAGTGMRDGFGTVTGTTGGPPLTEAFAGASATVTGASFRRYGFWGAHGYAAVETGTGDLAAEADGQQWSGAFTAAHAWTAGEATGTNPEGPGSATWRGIVEAARTAGFTRLMGTAELRIADLARPRIDAGIDLDDGGAGVALRWEGMAPTAGAFAAGTAGADRIEGRFHGPAHEEAWGTFDTGAYVGAFGAKRE